MYEFAKHWLLWFALVLLCFSFLPDVCSADTACTSLGSTFNATGIPPALWQQEMQRASQMAQFIITLATLRNWDETHNWFGTSTTQTNICTAAYGHGRTYAIAWYIGHGGYELMWYNYVYLEWHFFILENNGNHVYDHVIHASTGNRRMRFALLWSCDQASTIGGHWWLSEGPFGMPHCWLNTWDLSNDGYANPDGGGYVFIGWKGYAPALIYDFEDVDEAAFHFLMNFYARAFYGHSINDSLDYASDQLWGCDYSETKYYKGYTTTKFNQIKVYGDGDHMLPYDW